MVAYGTDTEPMARCDGINGQDESTSSVETATADRNADLDPQSTTKTLPSEGHERTSGHSDGGVRNRDAQEHYSNGQQGKRDDDLEASRPKDEQDQGPPGKALSFAHRSLRITWAWFPVNMSTGAMASLLSQQPYTFHGLTGIGEAFYIVNLVLFCVFVALIMARFIRKPRAFTTSLHHPSEGFFFGAFWVAVALIINGMQSYGVPSTGPWLVDALRVIFWIYFACALLVAVLQYHVIFQVEKLSQSDAMPAWILPAYPFLVTGTVASAIAKTQPQESAINILIAGIAGQGLGWILAFLIYTVYLGRLIHSDMPDPASRPGMYVSVGPTAYTCAGLISLGKQAMKHLPPDFIGAQTVPVGELWYSISVPAALFLWLTAIWFSALTTVSVLRGAREMKFTLQWWAFVFPNAGLGLATIQIGDALNSRGIKIAGSVITVILVPLWFFCAIMHVRAIWRREILAPGTDIGVDDVNQKHHEKARAAREKKMRKKANKQAKQEGRGTVNEKTERNQR